VTTVIALMIAAIPAPWLGIHWSLAGTASAALSLAVLLGGSLRLRSFDRTSAIATFSEVFGIVLLGGLAAAAVAMVALRSGAPMADDWLRMADSTLGLSAQALVAWLAGLGVSLEPLHLIYHSSFPQVAASILLLSFLGRRVEVWRLCFLFLTTLLSCALISFAIPAYGSFVDATQATIKALPPGAGTFWWESLNRCRSADVAVLGLNDLGGVIAFPSFHTIMALLSIQAWWWNRSLRLPILAWNLAVIFTTLPMGGHYFVDLVAGALLWLGWSAIAVRIVRRRSSLRWPHPAVAA
jgi:membrane-associated phospholipid phosphatase